MAVTPEKRLVTDVDSYANAFMAGEPVDVATLCGRLIRGRKPEDFETLTDDPDRRLVLLMGPDGLAQLPGKTGYEMLKAIGYTEAHIVAKVQEGNQFKLAVFPEGDVARLATWDNVIDIAADTYPDVSVGLYKHREALKMARFEGIAAQADFSFAEVDDIGPTDSRHMTYERYLQSRQDLFDTRSFLYYTLHLREQFGGGGYVIDRDGNRGMLEYVAPNLPIARLGAHALLDIRVDLPDLESSYGSTY